MTQVEKAVGRKHRVTTDGESTENWAIRMPGFLGTVRQLIACARCGENLPFKRSDEPRHFRDIFKPTFHVICDICYDELPDDPAVLSARPKAPHTPASEG